MTATLAQPTSRYAIRSTRQWVPGPAGLDTLLLTTAREQDAGEQQLYSADESPGFWLDELCERDYLHRRWLYNGQAYVLECTRNGAILSACIAEDRGDADAFTLLVSVRCG